MGRIRKIKMYPVLGGEGLEAFIFNETETQYEVFLPSGTDYDIFFFDRETLLSLDSNFQLIHAEIL